MSKYHFLLGLTLIISIESVRSALKDSDVYYTEYDESGSTLKYNNEMEIIRTECSDTKNFTILIPGWNQQLKYSVYAQELIENFLTFRRGSVIFVEFTNYSMNYLTLTTQRYYEDLSDVIFNEITSRLLPCFKVENGWIWGFSYGARLAINIGLKLKEIGQILDRVEVIEASRPGFDLFPALHRDIKSAAKNVQCIHCSIGFGTQDRSNSCHQNWVMGRCGVSQTAARPMYGYDDHGMCPFFYNAAFEYDFLAQDNPYKCSQLKGKLGTITPGYKMGPRQFNDGSIQGIFFADTDKDYPYIKNP